MRRGTFMRGWSLCDGQWMMLDGSEELRDDAYTESQAQDDLIMMRKTGIEYTRENLVRRWRWHPQRVAAFAQMA